MDNPVLAAQTLPRGIAQKLLRWYDSVSQPYPWRVLWQEYSNPYHVWVSEIMLQQTTIGSVLGAYEAFLEAYPDAFSLARASEDELRNQIKGLGYYRRFRNLWLAARQFTSGRIVVSWPRNYEEWLQVPGVGEYTAAAIASITRKQAVGVVDGNVERVLLRLFNSSLSPQSKETKIALRQIMDKIISKSSPGNFNQAVMELGQQLCRKQQPLCMECPLKEQCQSFKSNTTHLIPVKKLRPQVKHVATRLVIPWDGTRVLLVKRPKEARFLKDSWGFITALSAGKKFLFDGYTARYGSYLPIQQVGRYVHRITQHKIEAEVYKLNIPKLQLSCEFEWVEWTDVEMRIGSSLDHKAWNLFLQNKPFDEIASENHTEFGRSFMQQPQVAEPFSLGFG